MGNCIASGRAAGPKWTGYVLNEMRHVRGEGRFGIVKALPGFDQQKNIAIKNGWTAISWDHAQWHVNCLGITNSWILVVQVKYPISLGLKYGAGVLPIRVGKDPARPRDQTLDDFAMALQNGVIWSLKTRIAAGSPRSCRQLSVPATVSAAYMPSSTRPQIDGETCTGFKVVSTILARLGRVSAN